MKKKNEVGRNIKRAAATTTLAGVAVVLSALAAAAAPERASAQVIGDVLVVNGTDHSDRITVDFTLGSNAVAIDLGDGSAAHRFDRSTFHSASIFLHSGDDSFRTVTGGSGLTDVPLTVHAGRGNDSVLGGAANDFLYGGSGTDFLLGGAGTDVVSGGLGADDVNGGIGTDAELLGSGDDTAVWNPGEGNDTIEGGLGSDTLVFNGSDGDEQMSLTADGERAVFLRSLGAIRMDLDGVERLDLATLGGRDSVTIGNLSGTDIDVADIDLAASSGNGDAKADKVVVDGTDGPDRVGVTAYNKAVAVAGLKAETRITGADPTDNLDVETAGGNDRVAVSPGARALLAITFDLGAGQL